VKLPPNFHDTNIWSEILMKYLKCIGNIDLKTDIRLHNEDNLNISSI